MLTKQLPTTKRLTQDEINWILGLYAAAPPRNGKPVLKQKQHMPDADIYMLCYWYDDTFFQGTHQSEWRITRDNITIEVYHKPKGVKYIIDVQDGDVFIDKKGLRSNLGTAAYAFQFYLMYNYAFPLFLGKGHWANGKSALELGVAVPDLAPLYEALNILYDNDEGRIADWKNDKFYRHINLDNIEIFQHELIEINKQIALKG